LGSIIFSKSTFNGTAGTVSGFFLRAGGPVNGIINNDDNAQTFNVPIKLTAQNDRGSNSPQVEAANLAVGKLRKTVDDAVDGIMFGLNENLVSLKASLDELGQKLQNAVTNSSQITAQDAAYAGALQKLESLKNEQDVFQKKLEQSDRLEALAIADTSPDILDLAESPSQPASPNRRAAANIIFTGCFAVMAGLLLLVSAPKPGAAPAKA